jgi:hypothetical protein
MNWLICVLHEWQTLIASLIALGAACWTIRKISKQIDLQEKQIEFDRERYESTQKSKTWAARAALPDALSSLCGFIKSCVIFLMSTEQNRESPSPSSDAINVLKTSIEYIDPVSARKLFKIVVFYQIHNARFFDDYAQGAQYQKVRQIYDAVHLRALIDQVFEYARDNAEAIPDTDLNNDNMKAALRTCAGLDWYLQHEKDLTPVVKLIDERYPVNNDD